jgi:hypothetical protein
MTRGEIRRAMLAQLSDSQCSGHVNAEAVVSAFVEPGVGTQECHEHCQLAFDRGNPFAQRRQGGVDHGLHVLAELGDHRRYDVDLVVVERWRHGVFRRSGKCWFVAKNRLVDDRRRLVVIGVVA